MKSAVIAVLECCVRPNLAATAMGRSEIGPVIYPVNCQRRLKIAHVGVW
jgi:hypothetical protein